METLTNDLHAALDPAYFVQSRLGMTPDPWQTDTLRWSGRSMLLNCSRQSGKSTTAAALAVHKVVYFPGSLVVLISPSMRQSGELFKKVKAFWDRLIGKPSLVEDNRLSFTLETGSRVVSLPNSEATVRGFSSVDLLIEDEASRVDDALYRAVRPMLAVSKGRLVLMSTPFGRRGHFWTEWAEGSEAWKRVEVQASQCPRIIPDFLAEERRSMGELWYAQEYCCKFIDAVNQIFGYDLVTSAFSDQVKPLFEGV